MFGLGFQELFIILIIALIFFGPARLPQIGSGLGKAIRDFKKGIGGEKEDATDPRTLRRNPDVSQRRMDGERQGHHQGRPQDEKKN